MSLATKLYVGNLPEMVKDKELRDLFQSFGDVSEVAVLGGYGFVVSPPFPQDPSLFFPHSVAFSQVY